VHAKSADLVQTKKVKPRSVVDSLQRVAVRLQELSLDIHTTNLEMKRSLSLSSIDSSSRSEEGSGGQMSPEF
jgi:hypothetical protein